MAGSGRSADAAGGLLRRPTLALPVLAVAALVAVAMGGPDPLPPNLLLEGPLRWGVRVGGLLLAVAGFAGLAAQARRTGGPRVREPTGRALRTAAILMGVLAALAVATRPPSPRPDRAARTPTATLGWIELGSLGAGEGASQASRSRGGDSPIRGRGAEAGGAAGVATAEEEERRPGGGGLLQGLGGSLGPILFLILVAALVSRLFARRQGRPPEEARRELELSAPSARVALATSLDEVTAVEGDPRDQISAAYHALLRALTRVGAGRRPEEAPHEHLHRALTTLGVGPEPLHRLTGLYVASVYGHRPMTDGDRSRAAEALRASLANLGTGSSTS